MDNIKFSERLRKARKNANLTQENLAEALDVSYQAVSLWENGSLPATDKLIRCAEVLGVSLSYLVEDDKEVFSKPKKVIFNPEHMHTFIKTKAKELKLKDTLKALNYAALAHKYQSRKTNTNLEKGEKEVPYIYHPLSMACFLFSMGVKDDEIIAATIMHDVLEDCVKLLDVNEEDSLCDRKHADKMKYDYRELDKNDFDFESENIMRLVGLLTHVKENGEKRDEVMKKYYADIAKDPKASLIKCTDRVNNLGSMSWGLSRERMIRQINETEKYFPKLLKTVKDFDEYNDYAWQLTYQMNTLLDVYKNLL